MGNSFSGGGAAGVIGESAPPRPQAPAPGREEQTATTETRERQES